MEIRPSRGSGPASQPFFAAAIRIPLMENVSSQKSRMPWMPWQGHWSSSAIWFMTPPSIMGEEDHCDKCPWCLFCESFRCGGGPWDPCLTFGPNCLPNCFLNAANGSGLVALGRVHLEYPFWHPLPRPCRKQFIHSLFTAHSPLRGGACLANKKRDRSSNQ